MAQALVGVEVGVGARGKGKGERYSEKEGYKDRGLALFGLCFF